MKSIFSKAVAALGLTAISGTAFAASACCVVGAACCALGMPCCL